MLGRLDENDLGLFGLEGGDHGVGGVVDDGAFGNGDVQDLVSHGLGNLDVGEGDQNDLVGHGAGTCAKLCDSVGALGENECFHLTIHLSLTARP